MNQEALIFGKLVTIMKKECLFEKKGFDLFESFLYKKGSAQTMPVVAGCLVF